MFGHSQTYSVFKNKIVHTHLKGGIYVFVTVLSRCHILSLAQSSSGIWICKQAGFFSGEESSLHLKYELKVMKFFKSYQWI